MSDKKPNDFAAVIDAVGPVLEGKAGLQQTIEHLAAEQMPLDPKSAERLEIYQRFCAGHRSTALTVFTETKRLFVEDHGVDAWGRLGEAYFAAHPMFHPEINANGALFADYLKALTDDDDFDDIYGELADFEWWEWYTAVQPDVSLEGTGLRISPLADIRSYGYDFVAWWKTDRTVRPPAREVLVVFWRDQDGDTRRERVSARELAIVRMVHTGEAVPADWQETLDDLIAAGIVLA